MLTFESYIRAEKWQFYSLLTLLLVFLDLKGTTLQTLQVHSIALFCSSMHIGLTYGDLQSLTGLLCLTVAKLLIGQWVNFCPPVFMCSLSIINLPGIPKLTHDTNINAESPSRPPHRLHSFQV